MIFMIVFVLNKFIFLVHDLCMQEVIVRCVCVLIEEIPLYHYVTQLHQKFMW